MFGFCKCNTNQMGGILAAEHSRGSIPDTATCIQLMEEYQMLDNIRHHSLMVAKVADVLILELLDDPSGSSAPERSLVLAGALLHDIAKTQCLDGSCEHAETGAEICGRHGYPEVAEIVREHVILRDHDLNRYKSGQFTPREIVYYADKRVRHEQIVSLEERLEYILEQYGNNDPERHQLIRENFQRCLELEQALFTYLPFNADALEHRIRFPQLPEKMWNDPWA
jgi:putative nucleotidyltransferase with HDIG domain